MSEPRIDVKLNTIWQTYGASAQVKKLMEESYELAEAVNDYKADNSIGTDHILEEAADVQVMLDQVCIGNNIDMARLNKVYTYKVDRQLARIGADV